MNQRLTSSSLTVGIGLIAASVVGILLLFPIGDNEKGSSGSKPAPIVLVTPGMKYVDQLQKETKRKGEEAEWEKAELARVDELELIKKDFDAFVKNATDLDILMAIQSCSAECETANSRYAKAQNAVSLKRARKGRVYRGDVSGAIDAFSKAKRFINEHAARVKNERVYLSNQDRIKENTKRLAFVLNQAGFGHRINLHSCGLNRNEQGELRLLVWNGYLCYEPGDFKTKAMTCLKDLDFVQQKTPDHDLEIFLLETNDKKGISLWGKKKDFNWRQLQLACGLKEEYGQYTGVYASISLGLFSTSYRIPCSRLTLGVNRKEHCHVLVVDLRPQAWIPWSLRYVANEIVVKNITTPNALVSLYQPAITTCYGTANLQFRHLSIEQKLKCRFDDNLAVDGKITDTVNPAVVAVMFPQSDPAKKTAEDWMFDGREYYGERNYAKAFSCFAQAAEKGSEAAALNCGILLIDHHAQILDRTQRRTAFRRAEKYLCIAQQSKDVAIRSAANNLLGAIYLSGGSGITRNLSKAKTYFQAAASEGDQHAVKNLELLEKQERQENRRRRR